MAKLTLLSIEPVDGGVERQYRHPRLGIIEVGVLADAPNVLGVGSELWDKKLMADALKGYRAYSAMRHLGGSMQGERNQWLQR
jgi:hypothetical protein